MILYLRIKNKYYTNSVGSQQSCSESILLLEDRLMTECLVDDDHYLYVLDVVLYLLKSSFAAYKLYLIKQSLLVSKASTFLRLSSGRSMYGFRKCRERSI